MEETKVIQFDASRSLTLKKITKQNQAVCSHNSIVVDEETRTIECEDCEIIMCPFDYLVKVCHDDERAFERHKSLLIETKKLEKRYQNLTKEIEKLKNIRNAKNI